jgi:hypothetical protein
MTMQNVQEGPAVYFDGASSGKRQVTLRFGSGLDVVEDGAVVATWPFDQIRRADGTAGRLRLGCASAAPLARIEIDDGPTMEAVIARCAALDVDRGGPAHTARIVFWSAAAIASIVVLRLRHPCRRASCAAGAVYRRAADGRGGRPAGSRHIRAKSARRPRGRRHSPPWPEDQGRAGSNIRSMHRCAQWIPNAIALPGGKIYLFDAAAKAQKPGRDRRHPRARTGHVHPATSCAR